MSRIKYSIRESPHTHKKRKEQETASLHFPITIVPIQYEGILQVEKDKRFEHQAQPTRCHQGLNGK